MVRCQDCVRNFKMADARMGEAEFSFLPLQVLRVGVGGKRTFEPEGKR